MKNPFGKLLLQWYNPADRPLPWKSEKDPYKIWLSEIILQQTRAAQAIPYYVKFIKKYPNIVSLAQAPIDDILSDWQGLGYYSRARNLHFAANTIMSDFNGIFPIDYKSILSLKGVGTYTAAAISSFAYGLPHPVIDGNVKRVIARYFAMDKPVDTTDGSKAIDQLVNAVFVSDQPALFNQAIMDFGANVCAPKPGCSSCIMIEHCQGRSQKIQTELPIKSKKIIRKKRYFNFFYIKDGNKFQIQKREKKDIWNGLYQLPIMETEKKMSQKQVYNLVQQRFDLRSNFSSIFEHRQLLTHQEIFSVFWALDIHASDVNLESSIWINESDIGNYGFPRTISLFFENLGLIE